MAIKNLVECLEKTKQFKDWASKKENKGCYLAHILFMAGESDEYQIGYYNCGNDRIVTFTTDEKCKRVSIAPESEIFKKPEMKVKRIDAGRAKFDIPEVVSIAKSLQEERYRQEKPFKIIIILQDLEQYGMIYNVTFVTHSFKTLNIKIDAETGDIVHEELVSLIQFPKK